MSPEAVALPFATTLEALVAGKSMNGLYGVVNSPDPSDGSKRVNKIMKGSSGALLNAYSASFEKSETDDSAGPSLCAPMHIFISLHE